MGRKKRGSSLIYVIIMFMFISVVSTAMLSMISANYTARVAENKRVENLYGSDSGIDVAYNIMGKTFDAATKYGYYRVKTLTDKTITETDKLKYCTYAQEYANFNTDIDALNARIDELKEKNNSDNIDANAIKANNDDIEKYKKLIEEDKKFIEELLNEEFKSGFKAFFDDNDDKLDDDFKLKNSIESGEKHYVYQVSGLNSNNIQTTTVQYEANSDTDKEATLSVNISEPYNINLEENDATDYGTSLSDEHIVPETFTKTVDKAYTIKIKSTFQSKNDADIVGDNNRIVEATYVIKIPNYDDIFFEKSTSNDKYLALSDRSLTVGKNMNVKNVGQLTIDGDVFVNGEDPNVDDDDIDRTYKKYSGGIAINNDTHNIVEFKKDVITRNTFNIQDKTETHIEGNLYADNVYIGKIADGNDGFAEDSQLYINEDGMGKVILDNDFTVKAKDSEIDMNDFYGINDDNIYYKDRKGIENEGKSDEVYKSSSSIIINGDEDKYNPSTVIINKSAYIMGTAHIATDNNYQTGESGAVKGNYKAYLTNDPTNTSEEFEQGRLLDENNVFEKAEHFKRYWDENLSEVKVGGIVWPKTEDGKRLNVYSVGAIVYEEDGNKSIIEPNYSTDLEYVGDNYDDSGEICKKRIDFASKVYKFGQPAQIGEYNNRVYKDFSSLMDLSSISEYTELGDNEKAIFNPDIDTTIVIQGENYNGVTLPSEKIPKVIPVKDDGSIDAIIATAGDVIIDGDITFNGTIICQGKLQIKENDDVTISYNPDVVSRLQSQNSELFEEVFGGMIINNDETSTSNKSDDEILDTSYDIKKFLEIKLWKLKK